MNKVLWKISRPLNWFLAYIGSYFWTSCLICGGMYGGHEGDAYLMTGWNSGRCVCPQCKDEADRRNQAFRKTSPPPVIVYNDVPQEIHEAAMAIGDRDDGP